MSVEDAVTEGLATPVDQNAQAAEEAKRMLAEFGGEAPSTDKHEGMNGTDKEATAVDGAGKESNAANNEESANKREDYDDAEDEARERRQDRRHDHRSDRGGRREYNDRGQGRGGRDNYRGGGRGRGRGDRDGFKPRSYRENIKSDLTSQEVTDDPDAIRKQVHFYFSDSNLPKDRHLFGLTGGLENKPVPLKDLHSFKRMQRFQPFEAIVDALRDSTHVELADNDTAVRRKHPLPDDYFKAIATTSDPRTVYVKGFGEETSNTQFDIEAFFDPYGPTKAVRLRRNEEKTFKGSVFVEFEDQELAEAFLALDPKPKYKDRDLQIMGKKDYQEKKSDDLKAGRITSNHDGRRGGRGGYGERHGSGDHDKRNRDRDDDRDWRERRDEDQKRGFRDDDRRGDRERGRRGGKPAWTGGGRSRAPETDERGIPKIKPATDEKDTARDEALAKAKAAVEADIKKEQADQNVADDAESTDQNGAAAIADAVAESVHADAEAPAGNKRAREDDDDGEAEREIKKVDTKTEETVMAES